MGAIMLATFIDFQHWHKILQLHTHFWCPQASFYDVKCSNSYMFYVECENGGGGGGSPISLPILLDNQTFCPSIL